MDLTAKKMLMMMTLIATGCATALPVKKEVSAASTPAGDTDEVIEAEFWEALPSVSEVMATPLAETSAGICLEAYCAAMPTSFREIHNVGGAPEIELDECLDDAEVFYDTLAAALRSRVNATVADAVPHGKKKAALVAYVTGMAAWYKIKIVVLSLSPGTWWDGPKGITVTRWGSADECQRELTRISEVPALELEALTAAAQWVAAFKGVVH